MQPPTPTPSPPPYSGKRLHVTHTHLGLRPKSPDSLHARIRSTHPQPKHVSRIEDIVRSSSPGSHREYQQLGGHDAQGTPMQSINGAVSEVVAEERSNGTRTPTLRQRRGTGRDDELFLSSNVPTRVPTPQSSRAESFSDLASNNAEGTSRNTTLLQDEDGDAFDVVYDDEDDEIETTDIGLYRDEVYDEYLGTVIGSLRRLLVKSLRWESPLLARHQRLVRSRYLDRYFVYTSLMGSHSFFLIFLPTTYWFVNGCFARGLVNVLAFGVYFSSAIKDALCVPRPYSPPVTRLVIGTTHLEYGFLSTHSTNCISIVLYVYLWLRGIRDHLDPSSPLQSKAWEVGLIFYAVSVVYGRIYSGMHSVMDCVTGCLLGAGVTWAQWTLTENIESIVATKTILVPLLTTAAGLVMVMVHPQPLDDCPCFEDSIAFLSVVMGCIAGRWASVRFDLAPLNENPLTRGLLRTEQVAANAKLTGLGMYGESLRDTAAYWYLFTALRTLAVLVLGIGAVMATRVTVKTVCRIVLPPIFRFAQGNLGVVLPRRHYTSATDYAAIQAQHREDDDAAKAAGEGKHARSSSVTNGVPLHHRKESLRSAGERTDSGFAPSLTRSRSHSLQEHQEPASQIKFTLGDGKDLPVPFTHPNTHLFGDSFSERIAGALSAEERARQHYEEDSGHRRAPSNPAHTSRRHTVSREGSRPNGTVNSQEHVVNGFSVDSTELRAAAAAQDKHAAALPEDDDASRDEVQIRHYDVDVLTKVFVYHAIGFVASAVVPLSFQRIGLL